MAATMTLSSEEIERYARHIVLRGVGGPGQNKLKNARVLVVGAGGLGSPLLHYLAAAGVGKIGIVDDDVVSLSNLQRQVLHGTSDVGRPKVDSAADSLRRVNPHAQIEKIALRLDETNARSLIAAYDVIADGSDNFATRYIVSDACFHMRKPLITAAIGEYDGSLTVLKPYERNVQGALNPTYRCLFPEPPPPGMAPACEETGVLGALAGLVGSLMALEVIREIVGGFEEGDAGLVGKLLLIDAKAMRFETVTYAWDENNPLSGKNAAHGRSPA
jgi:molybdopterin/thiamine biosynthesis adenylyltransferase